jgi:iron(III) transport system substrate-binding protein
MSPTGQSLGAKADSLQSPANKNFVADKRIPNNDSVRLIKYDFEKFGKTAERKRLLDRWQKEIELSPK